MIMAGPPMLVRPYNFETDYKKSDEIFHRGTQSS